MKLSTTAFAIVTSLILSFASSPVGAQDGGGVSFQVFYDGLGAQGSWLQTDNYGYGWRPNVRDANWRPYSRGHWVATDYGWAWVSYERFGWATYHYGRWANIEGIGWVWFPGYRWAPAWVSWRHGGGYSGWAPLPPEADEYYGGGGLNVAVGFRIGNDADVAFNIGAGSYNFIPSHRLGERDYGAYYLNRRDNYQTIGRTRNISNIYINKTVVNNYSVVNSGGPSLEEVNAEAKTRVRHVKLVEAPQSSAAVEQGDSLAVYAPRVDSNTRRTAKPARIAQTLTKPAINRGDDVAKPQSATQIVPPPSTETIKPGRTKKAEDSSSKGAVKVPALAQTDSPTPATTAEPAAPTPPTKRHNKMEKPKAAPVPVAKQQDNPADAPSKREAPANTAPADPKSKSAKSSDSTVAGDQGQAAAQPPGKLAPKGKNKAHAKDGAKDGAKDKDKDADKKKGEPSEQKQ